MPQTDVVGYVHGLHLTFITLGIFTVVSSLSFHRLLPMDGSNVSGHVLPVEAADGPAAAPKFLSSFICGGAVSTNDMVERDPASPH